MANALIIITNDDGIGSPGLRAAAEAVQGLGEVIIVAPTEQRSAAGRGFWGDRSQALRQVDYLVDGKRLLAYHCDCSPAQVVDHGVRVLCPGRRPDLILSGINYGENLGLDVTLSGTIGAALQGASMGIPALAVSLVTDPAFHFAYGEVDWMAARHFARIFSQRVLLQNLPPDVDLLKVDIPDCATKDTPWRTTRLSRHPYRTFSMESPGSLSKIGDLKARVRDDLSSSEEDSDVRAVMVDRVVSVTPLSLDLSSRIDLNLLGESLKKEVS